MLLPDAVHQHPGRKRVVRLRQPGGQGGATTGGIRPAGRTHRTRRAAVEHASDSGRDGLFRTPRDEHVWSARADISHSEGNRQGRRPQAVVFRQGPLQRTMAFLVGGLELRDQAVVLVGDLPVGQRPNLPFQRRPIGLGLAQDGLNGWRKLGDRAIGRTGLVRCEERLDLLPQTGGLIGPRPALRLAVKRVFVVARGRSSCHWIPANEA